MPTLTRQLAVNASEPAAQSDLSSQLRGCEAQGRASRAAARPHEAGATRTGRLRHARLPGAGRHEKPIPTSLPGPRGCRGRCPDRPLVVAAPPSAAASRYRPVESESGPTLMLAVIATGLASLPRPRRRSRLQGFCRWLEQPAGACRQQRMDAVFIRTFDLLAVWVISVSYASTALLALSAYDAPVAIIAGTLVSTVVWFFTPARFTPARLATEWAAPGRPILPILLLVLLAALLFRTEPFRTMHGGEDQGVLRRPWSSYLQREEQSCIDDRCGGAAHHGRERITKAGCFAGTNRPLGQPGSLTGRAVHSHFYQPTSALMATFAELSTALASLGDVLGLLSVLGSAADVRADRSRGR